MEFVRLAGGLLWKEERVAVIHRPRQDDWSLPKGRVDAGESWEEAALREVEEETGCEARIRSFAGAGVYVPRRTPRIALFALSGEELALQAQVLRARARGLAAWRSRAVRRILPKGARPSAEAVYVAAQVCDEEREPKGPGRRAWIGLGLIAAFCGAAA